MTTPQKKTARGATRTDTRLRGRGLVIARTIWIFIAFIDLVTLVVGVPAMAIQVHTPCLDPTKATCNVAQLLSVQMAAVQFFGISLDAYVAYTMT